MKFKSLLSITVLLIAGCSTPHSSIEQKADRLTVPMVQAYTPGQYKTAAKEHADLCLVSRVAAPMLCKMFDDFGRMRDAARAALGLKVNVGR